MNEASLGQLGTELRNYKTIKEILRITSQKLGNNISVILPTLFRPQDWQWPAQGGLPRTQIPLTEKR